MKAVDIPGTVVSVKSHRDRSERLEIHVGKEDAQRFLNQDRMRVPVPLVIGSQEFVGGIRFTQHNKYLWICPNLIGKNGQRVSLVDALHSANLKRNDKVILRVEQWKIRIIPRFPPQTSSPSHAK